MHEQLSTRLQVTIMQWCNSPRSLATWALSYDSASEDGSDMRSAAKTWDAGWQPLITLQGAPTSPGHRSDDEAAIAALDWHVAGTFSVQGPVGQAVLAFATHGGSIGVVDLQPSRSRPRLAWCHQLANEHPCAPCSCNLCNKPSRLHGICHAKTQFLSLFLDHVTAPLP